MKEREEIWKWLVENGYIFENKLTNKALKLKSKIGFKEKDFALPQVIINREKELLQLFKLLKSIFKDIHKSAIMGGLIGAVKGGVGAKAAQNM